MSDSDIIVNGVRYSTTRDASNAFGISANYITRFCRERFVRGTRIGGIWYVDQESLKAFVVTQEAKKREWKEKLTEERQRERSESRFEPLPKTRVAPYVLHRLTAERRAKEESLRRTVAVASIGSLLFFSSLGVAFSGIAPIAAVRDASVASVADVGSAIVKRFTSFFDSLFAVNEYQMPPAWEKTVVAEAPPVAAPVVISSNQPPRTGPVERIIERIETVYSGGVSEQLLASRLSELEGNLTGRMDFLAYEGIRQTSDLGDAVLGIGGACFDDIDITDSTWTGGSISGATISGGSVTATAFSGVLPLSNGGIGTPTR